MLAIARNNGTVVASLHPFSPYPMKTLSRHLRAGTITASLVMLGATMAVAVASEIGTSYQNSRLIDSFVLGAPNDLRDAGNPFAGSLFDIISFKAHPCYDIAGMEAQMCADQYGISESLRSMLESGKVAMHLRNRGLLAAAPAGAPVAGTVVTAPVPVSNPDPATSDSGYKERITQRGQRLWATCRANSGSLHEANYCYARNMRLLTRFGAEITDSVH